MSDANRSSGSLLPEDLPPDHRSGFVAVVGKPNVGKSTLMNAYLGQKVAIVSPKPQTTRNRLLGILTRQKAQIIFVDTPGIHEPMHKLGEYMVETALRAIPDADVVLFMVDLSTPPTEEDRQISEIIRDKCRAPVILALNKVDLLPPKQIEPRRQAYEALGEFADSVLLSATEGTGRDELLELVISYLPPGPRYYPPEQITDQQERFIASELIREQVLHHLHQEVPYSVAVVVEEYQQRRPDLTYIGANIFVERESQKAIIIGEGGKMLRRIGQAARREIETRLTGHKVYLELWVKVRKKWRKKEEELRRLGYPLPRKKRG